ncbi:MAG: hypothetical protein K1Y36_24635 [Blastocatellia bacterium]|nr:hypothetical protein [Blastocatellia bacterium]
MKIMTPEIEALLAGKRFWSDYFWDTEVEWGDDEEEGEEGEEGEGTPYVIFEEQPLRFPLSPHSGLLLQLDSGLGYHSLQLWDSELSQPIEIAWDDQAHWHPHVLRWEELELLGRCVALADPDLPHPGLPLLLLNRFTPICTDDEARLAFPVLESAWRSLNLYSGIELVRQIERFDWRESGIGWQFQESTGWFPVQDVSERQIYSLRQPENETFPFAAFNRMVEAGRQTLSQAVNPHWLEHNKGQARHLAKQIYEQCDLSLLPALGEALRAAGCHQPTILRACRWPLDPPQAIWIIELLLGLPQGSFGKRYFGESIPPNPNRMTIEIKISHPAEAAYEYRNIFLETLNRVLAEKNLGWANEISISSTRSGGAVTSLSINFFIRFGADVETARTLLQEVLRHLGTPPNTQVWLRSPDLRLIFPVP